MPSSLRARLGVTAAAALTGAALSLGASPATASPTGTSTHAKAEHSSRAQHRADVRHRADKVIREAARQKGKPYRYGADGPGAFDCSGLVRYVMLHSLGRSLPHNAASQYHSVHHVHHRSKLRPGDLVFVDDGGYISHVGIFAGHHRWWVAPHSGTRVQLQHIYHAHFLYGRLPALRYHQ